MRSYILMRDKYKCRRCGQSGALEVHHIIHLTPENITDGRITLNPENLITLCRDCHFKEHAADKLQGIQEASTRTDCAEGFVFDANGYLVPVGEKK